MTHVKEDEFTLRLKRLDRLIEWADKMIARIDKILNEDKEGEKNVNKSR